MNSYVKWQFVNKSYLIIVGAEMFRQLETFWLCEKIDLDSVRECQTKATFLESDYMWLP